VAATQVAVQLVALAVQAETQQTLASTDAECFVQSAGAVESRCSMPMATLQKKMLNFTFFSFFHIYNPRSGFHGGVVCGGESWAPRS
jgi:hypothetical protein